MRQGNMFSRATALSSSASTLMSDSGSTSRAAAVLIEDCSLQKNIRSWNTPSTLSRGRYRAQVGWNNEVYRIFLNYIISMRCMNSIVHCIHNVHTVYNTVQCTCTAYLWCSWYDVVVVVVVVWYRMALWKCICTCILYMYNWTYTFSKSHPIFYHATKNLYLACISI